MLSIEEYQNQYDSLIEKSKSLDRKKRKRTNPDYVYYESHHIIPDLFYIDNRSKGKRPGWLEGNSNAKENLVLLTAEEHFDAHILLALIYPDNYGLLTTVIKMSGKYTITREEFGELRKKCGNIISAKLTGKKKSPKTAEHTANLSKARKGKKIPNRKKNNKVVCPHCKKEGGEAGMKHWHFDNCKLVPNYIKPPKIKHKKHAKRKEEVCPHCNKKGSSHMKLYHFDNCKLNPNYNESLRPQVKIVQCPHCRKKGGISVMKQHHFANCKQNRFNS